MAQCCYGLRNEFQLKKIWFSDVHPARFVVFQWRLPPILYLLYRIALAVYVDTWLIYTGVDYGSMVANYEAKNLTNGTDTLYAWPVYLTNWTYTMLSLYLTLHALTSLYYLCSQPWVLCRRLSVAQHRALFKELEVYPSLWGDSYEPVPSTDNEDELEIGDTVTRSNLMPLYFKFVWALFNIISTCSVMVTVVFFVFLWPQINTNGDSIDIDNLQLHGINSVIVFLEHIVTGVPIQLLHYVYSLLYGIIYLSFSAIFYGAGNKRPIYPEVLDWNPDQVGRTMIMVLLVGFVILPVLQVVFFIIYKVKMWIFDIVSSMSGD